MVADHSQLAPAHLDAERHLEQIPSRVAFEDDLRELLALIEQRLAEQESHADSTLIRGISVATP
jgi:hypothetical protein